MSPVTLYAAEADLAGAVFGPGPDAAPANHDRVRGDVAAAIGCSEAGGRATALVAGVALRHVPDLVQDAVHRMLPLVVRTSLDDGAAGLAAVVDTGAVVLTPTSPAEVPRAHLAARLIAERALVPVILAAPPTGDAGDAPPAALPRAAHELLGEADELVNSETPAQELLFGRHRRRVVRWFDLERPVMRGQLAVPALAARRAAGFAPFVQSPVPALLEQVRVDVERVTGDEWAAVRTVGLERADVVLVAAGAAAIVAETLATARPARGEPRVGLVALRCLRPLPESWLETLRGKRAVVVVEDADIGLDGEAPTMRHVRAALSRAEAAAREQGRPWKDRQRPALHSAIAGLAGEPIDVADLAAYCRACAAGAGPPLVWLGVRFAPLEGQLPKRLVLHEALRRAHPGVEELGCTAAAPGAPPEQPPAPARRRVPARPEPVHDDVARSWDVMLAAVAAGAEEGLAPDPYLTAGSAPALSALLRPDGPPATLPVLAPALCTGCGACWAVCPDAALLPAVVAPGELLECGVRRAPEAQALRPVLGRLARALPKACAAGAATAGEAVRDAAAGVLAKVDAGRRPALEEGAARLSSALSSLPVMAVEPFFARVEAERPGSGGLLALGLDADACSGCGLCIEVCGPNALEARAPTADDVAAARAGAALWRDLPDTPGAVVAAARDVSVAGTHAALLLSRHCLHAMAPGGAEQGSGARLALRAVLSAVEAHLQPIVQRDLAALDRLCDGLATRIRESLAGALPLGDLDALHEGLATLGGGAVGLSTLAARLDDVAAGGSVDAARLQQHVETARALADLRWRLAEGRNGLGRARCGLVLVGDGAGWHERFPWNPFTAPAVHDDGPESGPRALGLLAGELEAVLADLALVRRAEALLRKRAPGPRTLTLDELTADERASCPPLLLCVDAESLERGGLATIAAALGTALPIKVLLLADVDQGAYDSAAPTAALLALAHRQAFVLQSSVSHLDHLAEGVLGALAHPGPALLHVLAPSPLRAGRAPDELLELAGDAVRSRAWPLLRYDPSAPGAFGQKLSLAGNPAPTTDEDGAADHESPPPQLLLWRTLQELAGERTPFTEDVQQRAREAVASDHRADLQAQLDRHRGELAAARGTVEEELLQRLQKRLRALAGGRRP